ncbi:TrbC/VirB2 family protein [Chromobacterium haemolyticum]|uniref:TrbC/VirB2 family protein n=1 Tax=Chromobacterium fluminis TaxID=3044269 RepID=A0ABX0L887_9NEIS|nr:TrbC/VirB2 family protein [Chromobacterium haemolyticum]NHR04530.1 TrbC/VirB2 family protein [Chromobacterium haemolyticum]
MQKLKSRALNLWKNEKLRKDTADWVKAIGLTAFLAALSPAALAFKLPVEGIVCDVASSLSGPVATGGAVILIVVGGLSIGFGEAALWKWCGGAVAGLSIALLAGQWLGMFNRASACIGV